MLKSLKQVLMETAYSSFALVLPVDCNSGGLQTGPIGGEGGIYDSFDIRHDGRPNLSVKSKRVRCDMIHALQFLFGQLQVFFPRAVVGAIVMANKKKCIGEAFQRIVYLMGHTGGEPTYRRQR